MTPGSCGCGELPDLVVVGMGSSAYAEEGELSDAIMETLDYVKQRHDAHWWLNVRQCRVCRQWWLVADETRQNDVFCLRRLDPKEAGAIVEEDRWPSDFDTLEALFELGLRAGYSVRFADPINSSLSSTIEELARTRPGIGVSEIGRLLNLDGALTRFLAERVVRETGVSIELDAEDGFDANSRNQN
jgi:hypothetical protein